MEELAAEAAGFESSGEDLQFLIVESDPVYADYLAVMLASNFPENARIDVVENVPDAMKKLTDGSYDVCFLDHCLDAMSGLDVLRAMAFRDIKTAFIFLTVHERRDVAAEALRFGAMDCLVKVHFQTFDLIKAISFGIYRKRREMELQRISLRDSLTDLGNRALFDEQLHHAVALAERNKDYLGVALIDLDGFKPVNDTYGHRAGDEVLREIARRLDSQVRRSDVTARMGGDEFAAILQGVTDPESFEELRVKLAAAIADTPHIVDGDRVMVGASVGLAVYPTDSKDPEELIRIADSRMYADKRARKAGR